MLAVEVNTLEASEVSTGLMTVDEGFSEGLKSSSY